MKSLLLPVAIITMLVVAGGPQVVQGEPLTALWGVQTAHEAHYTAVMSSGKFSCLDGSGPQGGMDVKYVNDQFCDCQDGSDEPGTSACSFQVLFPDKWRFQCHTAVGGTFKELFHSRVNDGICDCCDGSDEYDDGTQCANNCAEAAQKEEKESAEREARRQAGLEAKKKLEETGETKRMENARRITEVEAEISSKEALLAPLRAHKEEQEVIEGNEKAAIHQESLKAKEIWTEEQNKVKEAEALKKQEEKDAAAAAAAEAESAGEIPVEDQRKEGTPEEEDIDGRFVCSKWRQTQGCKGDGERDDTSDKDCNALIMGGASGFCECFDAREGVEVKHPFDCNHQPLTCEYVCTHNGAAARGADTPAAPAETPAEPQFTVDDGSSHQRPEAQAARVEFNTVNDQKATAERTLTELKETTSGQYYDYPAFLALKDHCVSKDAGSYSYHVCMFKEIHQGSRGQTHAGGTLMGKFESFGEQTYASWGAKHDLTKQKYGHGQHCYSGPDRSVEVSVICGPTTELLSVDEPSMCTYKMVIQTPAVCE